MRAVDENLVTAELAREAADAKPIAEKLRADIDVCRRLERVLTKTQAEQSLTRDALADFVQTTIARKLQLGNTYHAAVGHRHVIANLV